MDGHNLNHWSDDNKTDPFQRREYWILSVLYFSLFYLGISCVVDLVDLLDLADETDALELVDLFDFRELFDFIDMLDSADWSDFIDTSDIVDVVDFAELVGLCCFFIALSSAAKQKGKKYQ